MLLRRLRRDPLRRTRIAVVTGVADLSRYVELMHFPPDLLLHKPVDLPKLLKWVVNARAEFDRTTAQSDSDRNAGAPDNRRSEPRFAATRTAHFRRANDPQSRPHVVRLLDCSTRGVAFVYAEPLVDGEWITLTVGSAERAITAVYNVRSCAPARQWRRHGFRIGAERIGFVSGIDADPDALLTALLAPDSP